MYEDLISVNIWVRQRNLLFLWRHTSAEARLTCLVSFSVKYPLLLRVFFFVCLFGLVLCTHTAPLQDTSADVSKEAT